jgi:DNA-binding MarR family transcriptional regulator
MSSSLGARYGEAALVEGYVAIPRLVMRHRRALGITPGEWLYLLELFGYWRGEGDPYPGVERLAADLGVDASTVRRYRLSLEAKGLLRVYREGRRQRYDLRPLLEAAVALERRAAPQHRAVVHAEEETILEKEHHDQDMTPNPRCQTFEAQGHAMGARAVPPATQSVPTDDPACGPEATLAERLRAIGTALGDDTPASSLTRATNLERELGVSRARLLEAIDAAATRVGAAAPSFRLLGADGQPNGMHYFFGVLRRELRGARMRVPPDRPREMPAAGAPGRPAGPEPAPITEANPVWRATLAALRREMTPATFATWLAPTRALDQAGDVLRVAVPGPPHRVWLERIGGRIGEALASAGHAGVRVEYVVEVAA